MFSWAALTALIGAISSVLSIYEFIKNRQRPESGRLQLAVVCIIVFSAITVGSIIFGGVLLSETNSQASTSVSSTPSNAPTPFIAPTDTPTPTPTDTPTPTSVPTSTSSYPQLKSFYSGTATGYTNATITFSLQSEDQQGNVSMQTTFQRTDNNKTAIYSCQGQVTQDNQLILSCVDTSSSDFHLSIHGTVFADGHMEGTEEATEASDPTYDHVYRWSVS
jgi:hypothetical protein